MAFVSGNDLVMNIFSNCGQNLLKASDIVLGLVSVW